MRGSLSSDAMPSNISCSSAFTSAPRTVAGSGSAAISSAGRTVEDRRSRMASISRRSWPIGSYRPVAGPNHPSLHCRPSLQRHDVLPGGGPMSGSVIVGSARTPIGKLSGAFAGFSADGPRWRCHQGRARARRASAPEQVDYVLMGQVLQAGQGQITRARPRSKAGIPMTRARDDHQQGLPVGHQRDLPRRPDDRRRATPKSSSPAAWSR